MRWFLRETTVGREPLAVAMTGVRAGERALQIGLAAPPIARALASKPGLNGRAAIAVTPSEAERARKTMAEVAGLVEVLTTNLQTLPFEDGSFDVAVLHNTNGLLDRQPEQTRQQLLHACRRVLRTGGRFVVCEAGQPSGWFSGLRALFAGRAPERGPQSVIAVLEAAGFRAVRSLGEGNGLRFIEATNL